VNNEDRKRAIIQLWLKRPPDERTRNHVSAFYGWLDQNRRELRPATHKGKDPYQLVQAWLTPYVE